MEYLNKYATLGPALWVASIPYGPSVSSVFFVLALFSFILIRPSQSELIACFKTPWFIALSFLIIWTLLSTIWAPSLNHDSWSNGKKVLRLILIPFFYLSLRHYRQQMLAWNGLIIGMLITFALSLVKAVFHGYWHQDYDAGHIFYNHIVTGYLAVFAAFVALYFALKDKKPVYWLAFFLLSIEVFGLNPGRAAYILYFALILPYLYQHVQQTLRWLIPIFGILAIFIIYGLSSNVELRFQEMLHDIHQLHHGQQSTSVGFRWQFYQFSKMLFLQHRWQGHGLGAYYHYFNLLQPVPQWTGPANPHSQYWLILVEQGIIGMGLWLWVFFQFFKNMNPLGRAYLFILLLNCFSDALFNACPGQLFLGVAGLCLLPLRARKKSLSSAFASC